MGKKGKRSAKVSGDNKAATTKKVGPGKARRERAAALRDIEARIDALADTLEKELQNVDLFDKVEDREDCPICFVRIGQGAVYYPCCGKTVCDGCTLSSFLLSKSTKKGMSCPFCRAVTIDKSQTMRRVDKGDSAAILLLANSFKDGHNDTPKDYIAALQNYLRAAELGNSQALSFLARILLLDFKEFDLQKEQNLAMRLATMGAKKGNLNSYVMLGMGEQLKGNQEQATRCWSFAAKNGENCAFDLVTDLKENGLMSQNDFDECKRNFDSQKEIVRTEQREAAKQMKSLGVSM